MFYERNSNHTLPFSSRLVNITIVAVPCSQIIRQKSGMECGTGPCEAMKALGDLYPYVYK